jgi:ferritin-like metal-binding protein YciE
MTMDSPQLRDLAIAELQSLLGSEPKLARGFAQLAKAARSPTLKRFCHEGVSYTERRAERIRQALTALEAPLKARPSKAMPGLVADAVAASRLFRGEPVARDAAILTAVERISHYGLASYTSIDRYLRAIAATKARRLLIPSTKEKREAIGEMSRMARHKIIARLRSKRI